MFSCQISMKMTGAESGMHFASMQFHKKEQTFQVKKKSANVIGISMISQVLPTCEVDNCVHFLLKSIVQKNPRREILFFNCGLSLPPLGESGRISFSS